MNNSRNEIITHFLCKQFGNGRISRPKYKWTTLIHNGLKFPEQYVQRNIPLIYNGKEIMLSKEAEEVAFLYAKYIGTDYEQNSTFRKNFFHDFKKIVNNNEIQSLDLCDFKLMKQKLLEEKEQKQKVEDEDKYKIAYVDMKPESVSNYKMEPPGIFIGRGKNPNIGKIKMRINPDDVTINISKDVPVPEPPYGHWKKVVHDRTVEWLASWKDTITGKTKYLWLAAHSEMKSSNDQKKFDIAKKLKKKIRKINEVNETNLRSTDIKTRQIATALFFIDKLALRVGNEKGDEDTADTVGVTSLRTEHITLHDGNKITLDFLGKDSVPYENTITVEPVIYNNVKEFIEGKQKYDSVFDKITSNDVNKYLQSFMKNLTAKVFRTYNASNSFQRELRKITKRYEGSIDDNTKAIFDDFIKANVKVAKMMNHQKNVSKGYKKTIDKINSILETLKKKLASSKRKKKKSNKKIESLKEKIRNYKSKREIVKEMKNISLHTSKANYIDPRITVAFMKLHKLDINKIFSSALQNKFKWAFTVDENYRF